MRTHSGHPCRTPASVTAEYERRAAALNVVWSARENDGTATGIIRDTYLSLIAPLARLPVTAAEGGGLPVCAEPTPIAG